MTKRITEISLRAARLSLVAETGEPMANASGFFCKYKESVSLITNWHVVSGCNPDTGKAIHRSKFVPASIVGSTISHKDGSKSGTAASLGKWEFSIDLYENDIPCWIEHPTYGKDVDVVAIPVNNYDSFDCQISAFNIEVDLETSRLNPVWIMDKVFIVGYPLTEEKTNNYFPIYKSGTVASEPDFHMQAPRFYVDGKTKSGMSGSAVVRGEGARIDQNDVHNNIRRYPTTLIGIYSGRDRQEETEFEAELGIIWPIKECLLPILKSISN